MTQIFAIVVSLAIAAVGIALFVRAIRQILGVVRTGQPVSRTDDKASRWVNLGKESLLHTRMLQWTWVGAAHWFVFVGFGLLFFTLLTAFGQLFDAHFALPLIGHFFLYEWASELVTFAMLIAIVSFIVYRANRPSERVRGPRGRFYGSTMWQGYFVEGVILGVGVCIALLRGLEYALQSASGEDPSALHFPLSFPIGKAFSGLSTGSLENLIYLIAMLKIVISFAWMITIALTPTMGVAWHRFTAWFNIWFKRESSGATALGALQLPMSDGKAITLDDIDDLDEDARLGVGAVEDFTWKGILDFTSCTECGRCQSQCPAWNTEKPLSPKLLITALRDHAYAKAPYNQAASEEARADLPADVLAEAERPLIGSPDVYGVIDPDVLWSCTSCGACVQQCPVDIEHVDHIVDMRRYQVLVESNFPAELNQLFKGLENKGNPWNMNSSARLDWAKDLPFDVPVVGESIESLDEVDWLFWVGCAGAYEDRAKKTTRAVAELLDLAGISFGVLGTGETCTGDPARRAGNEFVFQGLAQQNVETFKEFKVKKVVSTCAHCFNTLKNEYKDFGIELEVVHHTQLLNRLVREGKLTPVTTGEGAAKRSITYHDPCYIGRHNGVYTPPRELLQVLPGAELVEMERNSERSFCCGAGGARMWMEENIGERINMNRTNEAVATGADQIAVGCPFCRVMLSDGLTSAQAKGDAREEVEVLDVAQMLLASVKGEVATRVRKPVADVATKAEPAPGDVTQTEQTVTATEDVGPAAKASGERSLFDDLADPEPEAPAPASAGASLFDAPAQDEAPATEAADPDTILDADDEAEDVTEAAPASGGSLFDVPATEPVPAATPDTEAAVEETPSSGSSLFDIPATEPVPAPAPEAKSEPEPEQEAAAPAAEAQAPATPGAVDVDETLSTGGSLFDIPSTEAAPAAPEAKPEPEPEAKSEPEPEPEAKSEPEPEAKSEPEPEPEAKSEPEPEQEAAAPAAEAPAPATPGAVDVDETLSTGGSLFDIPTTEPAPAAPEAVPEPEPEPEPEPAAPARSLADIKASTEGGSTPDTEAPAPAPAREDRPSLFDY